LLTTSAAAWKLVFGNTELPPPPTTVASIVILVSTAVLSFNVIDQVPGARKGLHTDALAAPGSVEQMDGVPTIKYSGRFTVVGVPIINTGNEYPSTYISGGVILGGEEGDAPVTMLLLI